jgi:hypothetical protein
MPPVESAPARPPSPAGARLRAASYEELCAEVAPDALAGAARDALAHFADAERHDPDPPLDLVGGLEGGPDPRRRQAWWADSWWEQPFESPPLYAVLLHDAACRGGDADLGQGERLLLAGRGRVVPDSFRVRNAAGSLADDLVAEADGRAWRAPFDPGAWPRRAGLHYLIGSVWDQFGHFLLEGLARCWLLEHLREDVRAQLWFVTYDHAPLATWQLDALAALGVAADRLVYLEEPQRFQRLIVPSIAYDLHARAARAQIATWERVAAALDTGGGPERIYLSRSRWPYYRDLRGEGLIDRLFEARGFEIVHPQLISLAEQVTLVRNATHVAGAGGSGMYLAAFARGPVAKLVIAPRSYAFRDDQLISHLRGERLAFVLCPPGSDDVHPRAADFGVSLDVLGPAVDRWLAGT